MNSLKINFFVNMDEIIRKAKRKFGEDKEFSFAEWPDGSLRLIMEGRTGIEAKEKGGD